MGEKSHGGATTQAERTVRINYAIARLCQCRSKVAAATAVVEQFGCSRPTANNYLRAGEALIGAGLPGELQGWQTWARTKLVDLIEDPAEDSASVRASLKLLIDLLGLAAPAKIEATVLSVPFDPIATYSADPGLRSRALQLERDIADADETMGSVHSGANRLTGVEVPPAHPGSGSGGNGHAQQPDAESSGS